MISYVQVNIFLGFMMSNRTKNNNISFSHWNITHTPQKKKKKKKKKTNKATWFGMVVPTPASNLTYTTYIVANKSIIIIADLTPIFKKKKVYPITNFEFG